MKHVLAGLQNGGEGTGGGRGRGGGGLNLTNKMVLRGNGKWNGRLEEKEEEEKDKLSAWYYVTQYLLVICYNREITSEANEITTKTSAVTPKPQYFLVLNSFFPTFYYNSEVIPRRKKRGQGYHFAGK